MLLFSKKCIQTCCFSLWKINEGGEAEVDCDKAYVECILTAPKKLCSETLGR